MATDIEYTEAGSKYKVNHNEEIEVPVKGEAFVYNSLSAVCVGKLLGVSEQDIAKGIKEFELSAMRLDIQNQNMVIQ